MWRLINKLNIMSNTKKSLQLAGLSLMATGMFTTANASELFSVESIGSGFEIRSNIINNGFVDASSVNGIEAKCGEKSTTKSTSESKTETTKGKKVESKCGEKGKKTESKCGEKGKAAKKGEEKSEKKGKKAESSCGQPK
jgi:hypothetical protein